MSSVVYLVVEEKFPYPLMMAFDYFDEAFCYIEDNYKDRIGNELLMKENDNINRWEAFSTDNKYINVYIKNLEIQKYKANVDEIDVNFDDALDINLNAGYWRNGKLAKLKDLTQHLDKMIDLTKLSEFHKWQLVIDRVRNRPDFNLNVPEIGTFTQQTALKELFNRTSKGKEIRDLELMILDAYFSQLK